jgi:ankyrin repeat protein
LHLEQQKKRAREFLRAIRSGDPQALARLRQHHTRWANLDDAALRQFVSLHDTQFALAREQGFTSWPKLKAYANPPAPARHTRLFVTDLDWIADRVHGLLRTRASAGPAALEQIREWHPRFSNSTDEEIRQSPFSIEDARLVYAREHGFETWSDLTLRVNLLASNPAAASAEPFLAAFQALESRDIARLTALLQSHPRLASERGTNGNTLLNLAVSFASRPDWDAGPAAVQTLLQAGAAVNEPNDRGWTPLHAAAYANQSTLASLLIEAGASLDSEAHGAGGTPLVAALFWGHREVADLLARHSTEPGNLRVAAGLGLPDVVAACLSPTGALTPEACAARGFYRPHSGFPDWQPSSNPQEILDEALVWACKSDRVSVLGQLHQAGARLDADPYRGTPLLWAAFCNRTHAAAWLLDHGADVNQKATFGGLTHGQGITALHLAAQNGHLPMVELLVERGADLSIQEDLYHSTPAGAAAYFHQTAVHDYLRRRQAAPGG